MPRWLRRKRAARISSKTRPANGWAFATELLRLARMLVAQPASALQIPVSRTSAETFYDAMEKRIGWQLQASEAYDTKTASWFALTALVATVSVTALAAEHTLLYWLPITLAILGSLFWLCALISSYLVGQQGQISVGPTGSDFHDLATNPRYSAADVQSLIAEFIAIESIPNNERLLVRKASFLSWAIRFSLIEFVCYGAAVFVTLLSNVA